jgi:hypothetical protein
VAVVLSISGTRIAINGRNLVAAGIISGMMGTISGIHVRRWLFSINRRQEPSSGRLWPLFFVMAYSIALLALWAVGLFGKGELLAGFTLAPGVVAGNLLAGIISKHLDRAPWLRIAILTVAALSALALILRGKSKGNGKNSSI